MYDLASSQDKTAAIEIPQTDILCNRMISNPSDRRFDVFFSFMFLVNVSMFFEVRVTKPAQAPKKKQKHQRYMHQACTGTKKKSGPL